MAKVIITGGTGLIGSLLTQKLVERNDEVIILTTQKRVSNKIPNVSYIYWNPAEKMIDPSFHSGQCTVINLAGAGVAEKRWSPQRKKEIVESRTSSLQTIYKAVESHQISCKMLISVSAIGYYGSSDDLILESHSPDQTFLSATCELWEAEALKFRALSVLTSIVRVGIVLSATGGALKEFLKPLQVGIAAIPGDGKQVMSWVHIEDVCRTFLFLMDTGTEGTYNAVSDHPVTANVLFDEMIKIRRGIKINVPSFVLSLLKGEMAGEILKSARISNAKIRAAGFDFKHKNISPALEDLLLANTNP